jgi:hypothetical protein
MLLNYKPVLVEELTRKGFRFVFYIKEKSRLTVVPTTEPIPREKLNFLVHPTEHRRPGHA